MGIYPVGVSPRALESLGSCKVAEIFKFLDLVTRVDLLFFKEDIP